MLTCLFSEFLYNKTSHERKVLAQSQLEFYTWYEYLSAFFFTDSYPTHRHTFPVKMFHHWVMPSVERQVNPEKTKYMFMTCYWKTGQKHSIKIVHRSSEDVVMFKYLGTTVTDQNCMHEEITSRLNSENSCYHSVQSLLSSHLLSRNVKVQIYKTIIVPVIFYGYETWSLTLREEHGLRVFKNKILKRIPYVA
jgi:hypothetical protein